MKKLLSVLLVVTMLFAVMAPAASATEIETAKFQSGKTPIIYIRGNGEQIYEADGVTPIKATFEDLGLEGDASGAETGLDKDTIVETAVNILKPFILEGMLFDEWDNYGKVLYEEISPLFVDAGLDHDGNPLNGTRVGVKELAASESKATNRWYYDANQVYQFCYDWRLSPYDSLERLHTYVQTIMSATGASQVSLYARCLGGSLLSVYIDEYGSMGHIKNVMFSDVLSNESTFISKAFSGQIEFDATLVERYAGQLDYCGKNLPNAVGFSFSDLLYEIVFQSMSFFNQIGATDAALDGVEELYEKLYKALVPALCHAIGFATQVNNWTCVAEEDMDTALDLMFGVEGTETREMYSGLIAKIEKYRENISSDLEGFYDRAEENGVNVGFLGKYGYLNAPLTVDADLLSDSLVSLEHATMGATCAKIGQTLSDDYIADRVAEGNGKYISPDKMVDLSTCYAPDKTWIFKNAHHNVAEETMSVIKAFLNGDYETVDSVQAKYGYSQFNVYDDATKTFTAMTEENCADLPFMTIAVDEPTTESIFVAALRWFTMLFKVIGMLLRGELSFSDAKEIL